MIVGFTQQEYLSCTALGLAQALDCLVESFRGLVFAC